MQIDASLAGKTIERALTDGRVLVLRCTDGHEVRVTWDQGADSPRLDGVGVRIQIALPPCLGRVFGA